MGLLDILNPVNIISGALGVGSALLSHKGESTTASQSRSPAPWEKDMKKIWDDYLKSRESGQRQAISNDYTGVLGDLMSNYLRPAFNVQIGGQTVPVIPRRNLLALDTAAKTLGGQYEMALDPLNNDQETALLMQKLRYGSPTETGDVSRTPSILGSIGVGTDVFKSVYPALAGKTTTPTTMPVDQYSAYYNGQPLVDGNGNIIAI